MHGVSKKFGESYQKTNKTKVTNKFSLLPFKTVAIRFNTRLTTILQFPETTSKSLPWNRSQNDCHTIFHGSHVPKMRTFDGRLQAGKLKEVRGSQIRRVRRTIKQSYHLLSQEFAHAYCTVSRGIIVEQHPFPSPVQHRRIRCSNQ